LLEKPVAHSTASKFSAVLIGRIDSRYIFNSVVSADYTAYHTVVGRAFVRRAAVSVSDWRSCRPSTTDD